MSSVYERLGGEAGVMAAVAVFYGKVTEDDRVSRFFSEVDMKAQARKQVAFMSRAFGGPEEHHGKPLRAAHQKLVDEDGLNDGHFDAIAEILDATLVEMGVDGDTRSEVLEIVASTRDEVLCR